MNGTMDTTTNGKAILATTDLLSKLQQADDGNAPIPPANRTKTTSDLWIYRMVVAFLGVTVLLTVAGVIVLLNGKNTVPDGLIALGAATVGGLAGFLAPSPVQTSS
jgi:hypothetical protein